MDASINFGEFIDLFHVHVVPYVFFVRNYVNTSCDTLEPWQIIAYTSFTILCGLWLKKMFPTFGVGEGGFIQWTCQRLKKLPIVRTMVAKQMQKISYDVEEQLNKGLESKQFLQKLPENGWAQEQILEVLGSYTDFGEFNWEGGRVSGAVYHGKDEKLHELVTHVFGATAYHNPLHPDVFPGIRLMEAEIVRMVCTLFGGDEKTCGNVTAGGTESIFLVCKAYRDYAADVKGITQPNMVIPVTAHAAFDKAAHVLKIRVKHVPMDPKTSKVKIRAMYKAIDSNTCMLVGSSPAFPHGSIDSIEDIALLGQKYNIPVHVDACLGGFLVPFMRKAGFQVPGFDFTVPGVTSISADTHKYAYAPKGTSVLLFRNKSYRHYQYSVQPNWPGGIYGTPNMSGSRSGGVIATCWATLLYHGENYYVNATKKIIDVTRYIVQGVKSIPAIHVIGQPNVSVVAFGSDKIDIYCLSSMLTKRGWSLNMLQYPSGFHFCITLQHTQPGVADEFLKDLQECTEELLKNPSKKAEGTAAVYGLSQSIPDRSIVSEIVWAFLDACTSSENKSSKATSN